MAEITLGIDFGTSFCTMCACNAETGKPEVIRDENGDEKIPSVVYWGPDGDVKVGRAAMDILEDSALMDGAQKAEVRGRIILSVKRRFRPDAPIALSGGETVYPVDVAARVLGYLKTNAERLYFHREIRSVRLTHPVCFSEAQRRLLREAGEKAGFAEIELLEEPVAAAMGYAAEGKTVGRGVLVYDLGGGTLDLAYVQRVGDDGFRVPVASVGHAECGGDDFDRLVYDHVDASLKRQGLDGLEEAGTGVDLAALFECRKLKESLSRLETAQMGLYIGGKRRAVALTRAEFNQLIGGLVAKSAELVDGLLKRVKAAGHTVDAVILIGGSSRIPLVRETLAKVLPVKPLETMHGDDAVARGAAVAGLVRTTPAPMPVPTPKPLRPEEIVVEQSNPSPLKAYDSKDTKGINSRSDVNGDKEPAKKNEPEKGNDWFWIKPVTAGVVAVYCVVKLHEIGMPRWMFPSIAAPVFGVTFTVVIFVLMTIFPEQSKK